MFHINEFKKLSGVSVRTFRYYDKIGLLKPVSKTEGGHRLYSYTELKKLQQIQFLKTIGFQLGEIREKIGFNFCILGNEIVLATTFLLSVGSHNLSFKWGLFV